MASREHKRKFWLDHIEQWQQSGLKRSEYLKQHGLAASSFDYFLKQHAPEPPKPAPKNPIPFLPVDIESELEEVDQAAPSLPPSPIQAFSLTTPKGFKVELPSGFDLEGLKQIIQVLEAA